MLEKLLCQVALLPYILAAWNTFLAPLVVAEPSNSAALENLAAQYAPHRKHQSLFRNEFQAKWLDDRFRALIKSFSQIPSYHHDMDASTISPHLKVETNDVYSFPCVSNAFMDLIGDEVANFDAFAAERNLTIHRPNSMNQYGIILNELGMNGIIRSLQQRYILPLASRLYPLQGKRLDDHYSFLVRYRAEEENEREEGNSQTSLDPHVDDSDVTLNICLGGGNEEITFTGSSLVFCGNYGAPNHRKVSHIYHQEPARAVLHLGLRRHGAQPILSGNRTNLIVWNYDTKYRQSTKYKASRLMHRYQKEMGPPDVECLSFTHDRDYARYKTAPSKSFSHQDMSPWCPPLGKEYDGFLVEEEVRHQSGEAEL